MPKEKAQTKKKEINATKSNKTTASKTTTSTQKTTTKSTSKTKAVKSTATKQKAALIKKLAEKVESNTPITKGATHKQEKIPNRVRVFFGCSLLLFCISLYQAFLRPRPTIDQPAPQQEQNLPSENIEEIIISDDNTERPITEIINLN